MLNIFAADTHSLEGQVAIGYESQDMQSGVEAANHSLFPLLELYYHTFSFAALGRLPMDNDNNTFQDRYDFSLATSHELTETAAVAIGATYYWYPDKGANPNRTREFNFEVAFDYLLEPSVIFNYDIDLEQSEIILAAGHTVPLDFVHHKLELALAAEVAYLQADDPDSDQTVGKSPNGYAFAGAQADFLYHITESATFSIGSRVATNNDGQSNNPGGHETNFWVGSSLSVTF